MQDLENELKTAMELAGITPPEHIEWDDRIHRFPTNGKAKDDAGFYKATLVPGEAGEEAAGLAFFGDHRTMGDEMIGWRSKRGANRDLSEQIKKRQGAMARERQLNLDRGAKRAQERWEAAGEATGHPYLLAKGIPHIHSNIARRDTGRRPVKDDEGNITEWVDVDTLLVACRNRKQEIRALQRIGPDGDKKFMSGTSAKGCYTSIGGRPKDGDPVYIVEGLADMMAVWKITEKTTVCAFSAHDLKTIAEIFAELFPSSEIIIAGDAGHPGVECAHRAAIAVKGRVTLPLLEHGDWDETLRELGLDATRQQFEESTEHPEPGKPTEAAEPPLDTTPPTESEPSPPCVEEEKKEESTSSWRDQLIYTQGSKLAPPRPRPIEANAMLYLRHHEDFAGTLASHHTTRELVLEQWPHWYNATQRKGKVPRAMKDSDVMLFTTRLQQMDMPEFGPRRMAPCMEAVASERIVNPIERYLGSLTWDGKARLDDWGIRVFGLEDNEYNRVVCRKFMIAAVARAMSPGCKVDEVLIIEGPQGMGKSKAVAILAVEEDWFTDEHIDFKSKAGAITIGGRWIAELAELTSLKRSDVESTKAFIARQTDKYRPPYGRYVIEVPRTNVFVGTTNNERYLTDATGNRRYLPIDATKVDLMLLRTIRDDLWAEAVVAFRNREEWWVPEHIKVMAEKQQSDRTTVDSWSQYVENYIQQGGYKVVSVGELMVECIHKDTPIAQVREYDARRVGEILRKLGWKTSRNMRMGFAPSKFGARPRPWWHPELEGIENVDDLKQYRMHPDYDVGMLPNWGNSAL